MSEKPRFHYVCQRCTACCKWAGDVCVDDHEVSAIAKFLGMEEHEALIIAHSDTPHKHLHVILNRVHPITGRAANDSHTWKKFSAFAHQLEMEGGKVYCPQREENQQMRQQNQSTKYCDPVINNAWDASTTGLEFKRSLEEEGYQLAKGRKRLVVVDLHGKILNPVRHLKGVKTKDFNEKLSDLDHTRLSDADQLAQEVENGKKKNYQDYQNFSEQKTKAINKMQDRHIEEYGDLLSFHFRAINKAERELTSEYKIPDQEQEITDLKKSIDQCGFIQKLLRIDRRKHRKLDVMEANLANAKWRMHEKVEHLQNEKDRALEQLRQEQLKERDELHLLLEQRRPLNQKESIINRTKTRDHELAQQRLGRDRGYNLGR